MSDLPRDENWNPNTATPDCDWCGECEWCLWEPEDDGLCHCAAYDESECACGNYGNTALRPTAPPELDATTAECLPAEKETQ